VTASPGRTALVLGGGGVTGGWFELGVLRALDAALYPRAVTDFDVVVGVSCGSVVGSHVAAGIAPHRQMAGLGQRGADVVAPFERRHMLKPNWKDLGSRARLMPRKVLDGLWLAASGQAPHGPLDSLLQLGEALPAGFLDGGGLERFVRANLLKTPCLDRFEALQRELYVVAVDVDTHESVFFGGQDRRGPNISRAVLASSSFPPAFAPCRIDGHDFIDGGVDKNFHLDAAVAAGAQLIVCVNPLLPLFNDPQRASVKLMDGQAGRIGDRGMPSVIDQTVRMLMHRRMADSVADLKRRFPDVEVLMLEPAADDYSMFFYNVARFSARVSTARVGYLSAHQRLTSQFDTWAPVFARHGFTLRRDVLQREAHALLHGSQRKKAVLDLLGAAPA
jgi:predicted acylesterase/phospholipase RssA